MRRWFAVALCTLAMSAGAQAPDCDGPECAARSTPAATPADTLAAAFNAIRSAGCEGRPGAPAFERSAALDAAAGLLAHGLPLDQALKQARTRATRSYALSVGGDGGADFLASFAARQYCRDLLRPEFSTAGFHLAGRQAWVLLAAPFNPPAPAAADAVARRVLELTNAARAEARRCGDKPFPAARPLHLGPVTLYQAALGHSQDMARHGYFSHTGRDGSTPAQRITRARYPWKAVGENIASGQTSPEEAVAGWVKSPPHCANLMSAHFTEMQAAFHTEMDSPNGIYWTQLFGTPR
jgi:uncharacterized protein YkwD